MKPWGRDCLLGLLLLSAGCAGYRLGPTNRDLPGSRTVQVVPFENRTLEPRVSDATTTALRKEIGREGTFELATRLTGDLIVTGEILRLDRIELSFTANDVATAQDYKLSLTAQVKVRERHSNRVILDRSFTGSTLMRVGEDLPSVERQSLPMAAADLARQITSALADGSW
jgi:hypothetical protein